MLGTGQRTLAAGANPLIDGADLGTARAKDSKRTTPHTIIIIAALSLSFLTFSSSLYDSGITSLPDCCTHVLTLCSSSLSCPTSRALGLLRTSCWVFFQLNASMWHSCGGTGRPDHPHAFCGRKLYKTRAYTGVVFLFIPEYFLCTSTTVQPVGSVVKKEGRKCNVRTHSLSVLVAGHSLSERVICCAWSQYRHEQEEADRGETQKDSPSLSFLQLRFKTA